MPSAEMNRLVDHARMRLPGALDAAMNMELFAAADELFRKSNAWYEDITFTVPPGSGTYFDNPEQFTFPLIPTGGTIVRLLGVIDAQQAPVRAEMPLPGELILGVLPNTEQVYMARVALSVVDPVTRDGLPELPDWVVIKHRETLLDGLLGRMMSQTAKPYSSPVVAQYHLRRFRAGMANAKVEAQQQNVYRAQNWRFPQTFGRRRYAKP